ncbi:MAG: prepilin-type N-terminal cleavage/methylation domain-containing protein [Gallionella sp.]|nr:prepilin-type N-terminal cleavage/methylation domain-containing protein [Gallionella sp.]MDD4947032.1 prepilin-type N-terminal cleavage/methylation domain-containing protein [Gallionella sp.]MDD5612972.1 prepilin-type N-terminal cleavage/methylation domain-containing protein [Gallionella sp.]
MWKYNKLQKDQAGFTLVELAIVLVIVGLILAAVLKGQEMIVSSRVKSVENDFKGVTTAYYAYMDRYKALPGDDANAAAHAGTGAKNGDGDGFISGLFSTTGSTLASDANAESEKFWQHARMAGFLTGSATATLAPPPNNAVGGVLGVQSQITATGGSTFGMTGNVVCASNIPVKIAQAVDIQMDDGDSTTGTIRAGAAATTATTAATSAAYTASTAPTADTAHTLCMKI